MAFDLTYPQTVMSPLNQYTSAVLIDCLIYLSFEGAVDVLQR